MTYHRNRRYDWKLNDINDIDALSIAVPYSDAVFTDKAARNGAVTSRELEVLNFSPTQARGTGRLARRSACGGSGHLIGGASLVGHSRRREQ
jgi:hypothetical protein